MISIGTVTTLKVKQTLGKQIYLGADVSANILLTDRHTSKKCQLGDSLKVFVYVDADGHLAATTQIPFAQVGDIAWLKVRAINYYGAFLDWGFTKELLVPFSEQYHELEVGRYYLVKLLLDDKKRIVATTKIDQWLSEQSDHFKAGDKVQLLIAEPTDLGYKAIINHSHWGLLYRNELFCSIKTGDKREGYIKHICEDHKIDLTLHQPGYAKVLPLPDKILALLEQNQGMLKLSDKSPPEAIYQTFGVSKKVFKQAIGALYKKKLIIIDDAAIRLAKLK
jgi:predicted RNA-binding protein (virulence factor B family)